MKKIATGILSIVLVAVLALAVTACSGSKYKTMEDYVKSDTVQSQISTLREQYAESGMNIDIQAEGNKLIYVYTFAAGTEYDGMEADLEAAVDTQASNFEGIATSLKTVVSAADPAVVVRYQTTDGTEIYSKEFTAK